MSNRETAEMLRRLADNIERGEATCLSITGRRGAVDCCGNDGLWRQYVPSDEFEVTFRLVNNQPVAPLVMSMQDVERANRMVGIELKPVGCTGKPCTCDMQTLMVGGCSAARGKRGE